MCNLDLYLYTCGHKGGTNRRLCCRQCGPDKLSDECERRLQTQQRQPKAKGGVCPTCLHAGTSPSSPKLSSPSSAAVQNDPDSLLQELALLCSSREATPNPVPPVQASEAVHERGSPLPLTPSAMAAVEAEIFNGQTCRKPQRACWRQQYLNGRRSPW